MLLKIGISSEKLIKLIKDNGYQAALVPYKYLKTNLEDIPEEDKKFR